MWARGLKNDIIYRNVFAYPNFLLVKHTTNECCCKSKLKTSMLVNLRLYSTTLPTVPVALPLGVPAPPKHAERAPSQHGRMAISHQHHQLLTMKLRDLSIHWWRSSSHPPALIFSLHSGTDRSSCGQGSSRYISCMCSIPSLSADGTQTSCITGISFEDGPWEDASLNGGELVTAFAS